MSDENVNLLTQEEWRTVHNAIANWQSVHPNPNYRAKLQRLMDKIRDSYIAWDSVPAQNEPPPASSAAVRTTYTVTADNVDSVFPPTFPDERNPEAT